ncbi:hypothetical protein B0F90DRAFT_223439 [Multifurca ochricompacta]|uniref:Uncharacterized protein n=1 Tax=Multifurca ochricompacta TaxID=376703 RepID=A0AAD4LWU6_9AGAM|nr:hypothetical protein B0F90DRAFT_223439 [Multifurca ochricompacta]
MMRPIPPCLYGQPLYCRSHSIIKVLFCCQSPAFLLARLSTTSSQATATSIVTASGRKPVRGTIEKMGKVEGGSGMGAGSLVPGFPSQAILIVIVKKLAGWMRLYYSQSRKDSEKKRKISEVQTFIGTAHTTPGSHGYRMDPSLPPLLPPGWKGPFKGDVMCHQWESTHDYGMCF